MKKQKPPVNLLMSGGSVVPLQKPAEQTPQERGRELLARLDKLIAASSGRERAKLGLLKKQLSDALGGK